MVNQAKSQEGMYVGDLVKRLNMPEQGVRYVPCIVEGLEHKLGLQSSGKCVMSSTFEFTKYV